MTSKQIKIEKEKSNFTLVTNFWNKNKNKHKKIKIHRIFKLLKRSQSYNAYIAKAECTHKISNYSNLMT